MEHVIKELSGGTVNVTVRLSRTISWRIRLALLIFRLAGWVLPMDQELNVTEAD